MINSEITGSDSFLKFIGIDGCKDGWFCVSLDDNDHWSYGVVPDALSLEKFARHADTVLIDIPIGLLDKGAGERQCDKAGRKLLGRGRSSSVFPVPARQTLLAKDYAEAQVINRKSIGRGLSQQCWHIVPKIRDIDNLMASHAEFQGVIRECHPELCFWALNAKSAMHYNKKTAQGKQERLAVLARFFEHCHELFEQAAAQFLRRQVAHDDIIDAMACAVTAKYGHNNYSTAPALPERDAHGLPMEMVYWLSDD